MTKDSIPSHAAASVRYAPPCAAGEPGRLVIDVADKPVNVLSQHVLADLAAALDEAEQAASSGRISVLLLESGKPGAFVAGADIFELNSLDPSALKAYLGLGQEQLSRIEKLPVPTVALLTGAALGGGLEIALACDYRVAVDARSTKIGLPEVTLGLIPGWGGCVRLPRLVGLEPAARLITTGQLLTAGEALSAGIVDALADASDLNRVALEWAARGKRQPQEAVPDADGLTRSLSVVRQDLETQPYAGHYPAPVAALEVMRAAIAEGVEKGFAAERRWLVELRDTVTGQNLLRTFVLKQNAKRSALKAAGGNAKGFHHVGVIGGGTMGSGIAYAMLRAGLRVSLIETDHERAAAADGRVMSLFEADQAKGRTSASQVSKVRQSLVTSDSLQVLDGTELVVEAAFEDLGVKRELFSRVAKVAPADAILASNTSSLSIQDLSEATGEPSRLVGLHFFNPVPRMPLVEVVRTKQSDPDAVATAVAVALACGKTPIVVNDAPGFVVNRVLMPYLSEAMRAAGEGIDISRADAAVRAWGLPMGPFELLDTIGLDVIAGIFKALSPHLGQRVVLPEALDRAIANGWTGRKSGRGFYEWPSDKGSKAVPHAELLALFGQSSDLPVSAERLILPMVNESARALEEGVVASTDEIDLATMLGLGLAPFRGGVARFIDDEGPEEIVRELESLSERYGERFEPAPLLQKAADEGKPLASFAGGGK